MEVNKVEAANTNWFVSGWRPAAGWTCVAGLAYMAFIRPLLGYVIENTLKWPPPPPIDTANLEVMLYGLLGLGAYRTVERIRRQA